MMQQDGLDPICAGWLDPRVGVSVVPEVVPAQR